MILATSFVLLSAVLQIILYLVYNRKVGLHLSGINIYRLDAEREFDRYALIF